ncbi:MAG TPA: tetratricopeptide repeat protein [Pyrinomonadaceae bacterium]
METEVLTTEENIFDELDFDESVELRALVRSLKRARNFTLLFARCNQRPRQRELIEQIKNELPDKNIEVVYFENEISHFLDELKVRLEDKTPDAVFVYGLENSLGHSVTADKTQLVLSLNVSRNNFPQVFNRPIVFWLPDYGIRALMNGAPDFFSIRSGVYFFDTKGSIIQAESILSGDYFEAAGLSFDERAERISHIESLLTDYQSLSTTERNRIFENQLKHKLARLFEISAQYDKAIQMLESLLITVKEEGDLDFEAAVLSDLARCYKSLGRYKEAEPLYQESLRIDKQIFGKMHSSTASSYNNLAELYRLQGKIEEAKSLYQEAILICEQVLGKNHPYTAINYNNLALLYVSQDKYEEAETLFKDALLISERILGKNHPYTATSYSNLAELYFLQGRYKEAEPLYKEALRIRERVFGKNHPDTAISYNNLAGFYALQNNMEKAGPLYKNALGIFEKVLGEEHPSTQTVRRNLEIFQEEKKNLK